MEICCENKQTKVSTALIIYRPFTCDVMILNKNPGLLQLAIVLTENIWMSGKLAPKRGIVDNFNPR